MGVRIYLNPSQPLLYNMVEYKLGGICIHLSRIVIAKLSQSKKKETIGKFQQLIEQKRSVNVHFA